MPTRFDLRRADGAAAYVALGVMAILFVVAGVAFQASQVTSEGTKRDRERKRALPAAEAGMSMALQRLNRVETVDAAPCVVVGGDGQLAAGAAAGDGWCPAITGEVGGASYSYRVKRTVLGSPTNLIQNRIVSTATNSGQTRRVMLTAATPTGTGIFGGAGVKSLLQLDVLGNARVTGDAASNRDIKVDSTAQLCGNAYPGPGHSVDGSVCAGYTTSPSGEPFVLAPPEAPSSSDTNRFFGDLPAMDPSTGNVTWSPASRELSLTGSGTLTLGGSSYIICKLTISGNGTLNLVVAEGASVTLFFDSPENCGYTTATNQLDVSGNGQISAPSSTALRMVFLGSEDPDLSKVLLAGNSSASQNLLIYAPRTTVDVQGNGSFSGGVAARKVTVQGNAQVTYSGSVDSVTIPLTQLYKRQQFVECKPAGSGAPDQGC